MQQAQGTKQDTAIRTQERGAAQVHQRLGAQPRVDSVVERQARHPVDELPLVRDLWHHNQRSQGVERGLGLHTTHISLGVHPRKPGVHAAAPRPPFPRGSARHKTQRT